MSRPKTWLDAYRESPRRLIVGLMSGTSADGVDAALCEIYDSPPSDRQGPSHELRAKVLHMATVSYSPAIRQILLGDLRRLDAEEVCRLNFLIAGVFAEAAVKCIEEAGLDRSDVAAISSHGQTLTHFPKPDHQVLPVRATLQAGDISVIAKSTGILTVGDFRPADMAEGGQGAPLVPYADFVLLSHPKLGRVVQNIGGIGNCTYLLPDGSPDDVIAFDTGPGNMIVDALVSILTNGERSMDTGGKMAFSGKADEQALDRLLRHPFYSMRPPKSTGREDFGVQYAREVLDIMRGADKRDVIATASELTVQTVVRSYRDFIFPKGPVDQVIVGGGGAKNPYFMERLRQELGRSKVLIHEDLGIPGQAKEALAFAILGDALLMGKYNNVPSATGARKPVVMGKIALP